MHTQVLTRNNKQYVFFPDITTDSTTRGFLVDPDDQQSIEYYQTRWIQFADVDHFSSFSMYIASLGDASNYGFEKYVAIPNSQLTVVGKIIQKHSQIIKKRKFSTL